MIYAGILAAGLGTRMHRQDMPKQFLTLGEKPIILHALEQFLINPHIGRVIVVAPDTWRMYTEDLLSQINPMNKELFVISGGVNKTESIYRLSQHIDETWGVDSSDVLISHDAIRPFITQRIIDDNIATARSRGAANTAMITNDTILISKDGMSLASIPSKSQMFAEQTPQSYMLKGLRDVFSQAIEEGVSLQGESELARLYIQFGNEMGLVNGEYSNMKIVNPYDLEVANALLKERKL